MLHLVACDLRHDSLQGSWVFTVQAIVFSRLLTLLLTLAALHHHRLLVDISLSSSLLLVLLSSASVCNA
jgi:hypothetical protein